MVEIDHNKTEHATALQRSGYIAIDQNTSDENLNRLATQLMLKANDADWSQPHFSPSENFFDDQLIKK